MPRGKKELAEQITPELRRPRREGVAIHAEHIFHAGGARHVVGGGGAARYRGPRDRRLNPCVVLRSAPGGVDRPAAGSYTRSKSAVAGCTMPRWSPCSIRGKSQGKLRKPVRSVLDQANCDSRLRALKSSRYSDLRRVSEWLAATLETQPHLSPAGYVLPQDSRRLSPVGIAKKPVRGR